MFVFTVTKPRIIYSELDNSWVDSNETIRNSNVLRLVLTVNKIHVRLSVGESNLSCFRRACGNIERIPFTFLMRILFSRDQSFRNDIFYVCDCWVKKVFLFEVVQFV